MACKSFSLSGSTGSSQSTLQRHTPKELSIPCKFRSKPIYIVCIKISPWTKERYSSSISAYGLEQLWLSRHVRSIVQHGGIIQSTGGYGPPSSLQT